MTRPYSPNVYLHSLIQELRKTATVEQAPVWKRIAQELARPSQQRRVVNLSRINRHCSDNEIVLVPGKVLGSGVLERKLTIAAYDFSAGAREQIHKNNGKTISITELLKQNPKGKNIKIIG